MTSPLGEVVTADKRLNTRGGVIGGRRRPRGEKGRVA